MLSVLQDQVWVQVERYYRYGGHTKLYGYGQQWQLYLNGFEPALATMRILPTPAAPTTTSTAANCTAAEVSSISQL